MILAFQLLGEKEQTMLKKKIFEIESMVLEDEYQKNRYKCDSCKFKFQTVTDWFELSGCPKCGGFNIITVQDRQSLYDIEMAMESNRDFNAFFMKYGDRVTKFDVERRLNLIKTWVFMIIRNLASSRRFKRFR